MDFKSDSNLGQNAAQMWRCFISVLEIMRICFAQTLTLSSVLNLKRIVKERLTLFKETYGARILPK